jgi:dolichol-phosphate mannosyltransferase
MPQVDTQKKIPGRKVTVVVPARNEADNIGLLLDEIKEAAGNVHYPLEVIVVDDHSQDSTVQIAMAKGAKVIQNSGSCGKGNALKEGFKQAEGDFIIMMDADYSHRPQDIPLFIQAWENGAGLVIGSRIYGGSEEYTRLRAFGNIFFTGLFGMLLGRYLSDALNGFKGFQKELVKNYCYESSNFEIEIELLANALRSGYKIVEFPSHERTRKSGSVKSRIGRDGLRFLMRIIKEWWRLRLFHSQGKQKRALKYER